MARRTLAVVPDLDEAGLPPDEWGDLTPNGQARCKAVKANGKRCQSWQSPRTGFCYQHDPAIPRDRKDAARQKGGHNSSRIARMERMLPPRLRPVFDRLEQAMVEVVDGTLSPTRAQALASLASASVRVLEAGEMEERMRKIEDAAGGDELDAGGEGGMDEGDDA